jgi:hypothetical protein
MVAQLAAEVAAGSSSEGEPGSFKNLHAGRPWHLETRRGGFSKDNLNHIVTIEVHGSHQNRARDEHAAGVVAHAARRRERAAAPGGSSAAHVDAAAVHGGARSAGRTLGAAQGSTRAAASAAVLHGEPIRGTSAVRPARRAKHPPASAQVWHRAGVSTRPGAGAV